ncbi:MAG: hypothetical protein H6Q42_3668 [Deltaproteobacteria bacterium]|jgi:hypothetical protein|nr:hypothetical protein [Deltaproteobacteria bacterium]
MNVGNLLCLCKASREFHLPDARHDVLIGNLCESNLRKNLIMGEKLLIIFNRWDKECQSPLKSLFVSILDI